MTSHKPWSRRAFLAQAAGSAIAVPAIALGEGSRRLVKIGLVGCGGRGTGALQESFEAAKILGVQVRVVATADYFKDRAERVGKYFDVPPERCFGGPASYRQLLETDAEVVFLVTAPLFRPPQLEACVQAGKHVFIEKPVAVDPPGCRRVIAAGELAKKKGLSVIAGTEMRHDFQYRETHQAVVVEGALGRLFYGRISFAIGHMFSRQPIQPKTADDLVRTWQNWTALSGDHIVEQHVHNIDIANWFVGRPPVSAVAFGGRARRPAGDMYDFFSADFDYGDGVHVHSMCRQVDGCWNWIGHDFVYERGSTDGSHGPKPKNSPIPPDLPRAPSSPIQEQVDVLYHVLKGEPVDQARAVAESTAAAVLARISAYTGQKVTWEEIMGDPKKNPDLYNLTLKPTAEDFEAGTVEIPKEGAIALPGRPA